MNRTSEREWAKEIIIEGIDHSLEELFNDPINGVSDLDSQSCLIEQRNRIAKLLNFPRKTLGQLEFGVSK